MPRLGSLLDNAAQLSLRQTTSRLAGWSLSACNSSLSTTRRAVSAVAGPGKTESDLEKRGRTRRHHGPLFASSMRSSVGSARPFLTSAPRKMAKPLPDAPAAGSSQAVYTTKTRRIGLIASKKGMMTFFDEWGQQVAVTVLKVESNHVLAHVPRDDGKHTLIQIGAIDEEMRRIRRSQRGLFKRAGVTAKKVLAGFSVTNDAIPAIGAELFAAHFVAGQYVDVKGRSVGKGTQGVMKRWGFKGLPASHGVSLKHRSGGSIGANQDPGRVWKGKKMAGKMGNKSSVAHNLKVLKIDNHLNVIYVKGAVPGPQNRVVKVRDAVLKTWRGLCFPKDAKVPMPTATEEARTVREVVGPQKVGRDPLLVKED